VRLPLESTVQSVHPNRVPLEAGVS
jgi:hypothetical protein